MTLSNDKWVNLEADDVQEVSVNQAGYHSDFDCTRRLSESCSYQNLSEATHYVRFHHDPAKFDTYRYFYACEDCIRDFWWEQANNE